MTISADLGPISEFVDISSSFAKSMSKKRTERQIAEAMAHRGASNFGFYLDARSVDNPKRLHHVYDWNQLGNMAGRLWANMVAVSGDRAMLSYTWVPSNKPVPVGPEVSKISNDTRQEIHIFEWKAPLMEAGEEVRIVPNQEFLAFPAGGRMIFTRNPIQTRLDGEHVGAFQEEWISFFQTYGVNIVMKDIEDDFDSMVNRRMNNGIINQISQSIPNGRTISTKAKRNHATKVENMVQGLVSGMLRKARFGRGTR